MIPTSKSPSTSSRISSSQPPVDRTFLAKLMPKGKIHIYTGDGHGKTPAALGEALYAAAEGKLQDQQLTTAR